MPGLVTRPRILVTGSNGFVGRNLCNALQGMGVEVIKAVRTQSAPDEVVVREIGPETDWARALDGCDTVVHLAARAHVLREHASDALHAFREVNVAGTERLARSAVTAGVRRLVFISSVGVNGSTTRQDRVFTENEAPSPQNAYAWSKYEAEQVLLDITADSGMEVVIIRPPLVYGPGAPGNFKLLLRWVRRGMPMPFGAVRNKRSLIALENLVDFIALCADRERSPLAANQVFLVSDGEDVSTPELLHKVALAYGKKLRLFSVPPAILDTSLRLLGKAAMADSLLGSLLIDSSKARDLLGWKPVVSMEDQLKKMAGMGLVL